VVHRELSAPIGFARWEARGRLVAGGGVPRVMGIINVTPDSFSDGGKAFTLEGAIALAAQHAEDQADLLDIGGESSRPGADPVALQEELRRVLPVVEALAGKVSLPISIDTAKAEVARQALAAGAAIINDITALSGDPAMTRVAAESGAGVVLMHMRGNPQTMQDNPQYGDVVREVYDYLGRRLDAVERQGIPRVRIAVDPGIGFGKTSAHNLELLRNLDRFASLGCAVLIGISRKGLLAKVVGRPAGERVTASVVCSLLAAMHGAGVVRVHDVRPTVDAIKVWLALRGGDDNS
jgi:dihydropteroate synthase